VTVAELIAALQQFAPDLQVAIEYATYAGDPIVGLTYSCMLSSVDDIARYDEVIVISTEGDLL